MLKQNINLEAKDFAALATGARIFEVVIKDKTDKKNLSKIFHVLTNRDMLLRIEKKKKDTGFVNESFIRKVVSVKNLVSPAQRKLLKEIWAYDRVIKEKVNEAVQVKRETNDQFDDRYSQLEKRWQKIEKIQKTLGLSLLRVDKIGYCKVCNALRQLSVDEPKPTCDNCKGGIKSKSIKNLPPALSNYCEGRWLEDYVAERLKKLGWQVWTQLYVYGSSSVKFEIDILATKDGRTLIVECKSGKAVVKDLSAFLAKYYDIKTNLGLFISLTEVHVDMKDMVGKNPSLRVFDSIKNTRDLDARLKKLLK